MLADLQGGAAAADPDGSGGILGLIDEGLSLPSSELDLYAAVLLVYAMVEGVEAVGLWLGKRWAEYLTLLVTASLLPVEVYELTEGVTPFKVTAFVINVAVVVYLLFAKRLFGLRGGQEAEERLRAADVGWDALRNVAEGERSAGATRLAGETSISGASMTSRPHRLVWLVLAVIVLAGGALRFAAADRPGHRLFPDEQAYGKLATYLVATGDYGDPALGDRTRWAPGAPVAFAAADVVLPERTVRQRAEVPRGADVPGGGGNADAAGRLRRRRAAGGSGRRPARRRAARVLPRADQRRALPDLRAAGRAARGARDPRAGRRAAARGRSPARRPAARCSASRCSPAPTCWCPCCWRDRRCGWACAGARAGGSSWP